MFTFAPLLMVFTLCPAAFGGKAGRTILGALRVTLPPEAVVIPAAPPKEDKSATVNGPDVMPVE